MKRIALVAAAAMMLPVAAQAQEFVPFEGFYVGLGGGALWGIGSNAGTTTYTGFTGAAKAGYDFLGPRIELEVGYGFVPSNAFLPGTALNGGGGSIGTMINGYYDFMPASIVSPYIGVGVGAAFIDSNTRFGNTQFAYQAMVGLAYHITSNWAAGIEARYLGTTDPSFSINGQTFSYKNQGVAALVGIAYKFGGPSARAAAPPPAPQQAAPPSFMVFFDFDRSNLSAQAESTIQQAAGAYKTKGSARVTATGHADKSGPDAYNMALSLRRANTVKDALVRNGVPAASIAVVGRGESMPLVQTADGVREPQNRRVEIVIQ